MRKIVDFFEELSDQKWSGLIEARASEGLAYISLRKGRFLYAHRPIDRSLERLEKISSLELPPIHAVSSHQSWTDFMEVCLKLNPHQTQWLMRFFELDRFEVFFRIFFWTNLELVPQPQDSSESDESKLSYFHATKIENLLKEAQQRELEWPKIQERLESSKRIFVLSSTISHDQFAAPDAIDLALRSSIDQISSTQEAEMEKDLLRLCNGKNTIEDLIRRSYQGEFLVLRQLVELWDRGLIEPSDQRSRSTQRAPGSRGYLRDLIIAFSMAVTLGAILNLYGAYNTLLHKASNQIPNELSQSLELYRAQYGQYPQQLRELNETKPFFFQEGHNFPYQWQSPSRYQWNTKQIE